MNISGRHLIMIAPIASQVKTAKDLGLITHVIWDRAGAAGAYEAMVADVKKVADTYCECDLKDKEDFRETLQACVAEFGFRYELYHGGMDQYFSTYYEVGRELGKVDNAPETVKIFSDKNALRKMLDAYPDFRINYSVVNSPDELHSVLSKRNGPVILKPAISFGSQNIRLIRTEDDAKTAIKEHSQMAGRPFMVEEFFEGTQFSVEAYSTGGSHHIIGITEKFPVLPPYFVEMGGIFPAQISSKQKMQIENTALQFLKMSGLNDGATHTEVILSGERVVIVESHLRAGGLIPFAIEAAFDLSVNEIILKGHYQKQITIEPKIQKVAILGIVNFENGKVLESVGGRDEVAKLPFVRIHNIWAKNGDTLKVPQCNLDRHGYIVVSGDNYQQAQENLNTAIQTLQPRYRKDF